MPFEAKSRTTLKVWEHLDQMKKKQMAFCGHLGKMGLEWLTKRERHKCHS